MVVRNSWSMVACVCLVGAIGCHKSSSPNSTSIPVITDFQPHEGPVNGTITITGTGFDGTTNVSVGGAWAAFNHINDTELQVTVPTTAVTGIIGIINGLGSGGSNTVWPYSFYVTPQVLSVSPITGGPGTSVTLVGYGLTGAQSVEFGTGPTLAVPVVNSANQLTVTVPLGSATGPVTVTVPAPPVNDTSTTPTTTTAASPSFAFQIGSYTTPVFTSFTPAQAATGADVTITGTGMLSVSGVTFGGVSAYFTASSDTSIVAQVPDAGISGNINLLSVLSPTAPIASPSAFTIQPSIAKFTPVQGTAGTLVTLAGTGFVGTSSISFGGTVNSNFVVTGPNSAQANVAAGSSTGPITLVSNGLTCTSSTSFTYAPVAVAAPVITAIATSGGGSQVAVGDTVTVTGSGFTGLTEVTLGGAVAAFTLDATTPDTLLTFIVPSDAVTGYIALANNQGGAAGSATPYSVTPTITSFTPAAGGAVGSTVVLTGTGFVGTTAVTFNGGISASFVVTGPNQITTQVPVGATTGAITVVSSGLTGISSSFTVTQ